MCVLVVLATLPHKKKKRKKKAIIIEDHLKREIFVFSKYKFQNIKMGMPHFTLKLDIM